MLITGANGMLGKSLSKLFPKATLLKGKANLDLTNIEETNNYLEGKHFDVIIHCAAFTDLNYCDNNPIKSRILHSEIVDHLCKYCNKLIYISTNPTDAQRIYYLTKQEGEKRTMLNNSSNIVLRTNIYGKGGLADWAISELKNKKQIKGFFNVLFNAIHVDQLSNIIKDILLDEFSGGVMDIAGNYTICLIANYLNLDLNLISKSKSLIPQNLVIDTSENISLNEGLKLLKKDYE